ncbi:MAG: PSD1 and planctomycete cytochrome C domain-containing protein [Pirellulales bacterium]|nr:PSD1 and planctomycete cytochrome C domain-containing protein [Pirellulales bacterium]
MPRTGLQFAPTLAPLDFRALPAFLMLLVCCALVSTARSADPIAASAPSDSQASEFFEAKIRPLLVERCQACHGPDKQWADLRLDSAAGLQKGGESGPVVVPGKPDESELVARVAATDADLRMPPAEAGPALSAEQIANLRHWIALGAPYPVADSIAADARAKAWRNHWAFGPVTHPEPPPAKNPAWVRNPIDQFIAKRLDAAELEPTAEADRRTLIRRLTYDLIGLPPTPQEVADFVRDAAADAYERLVDRLLASPRYGEHWGRHWLDVARYSDTKGYVYAREERFFVNSSLYRDWVIRATNDDLPFDRFVLLQLAADQTPTDDPRDLAAMGFLTLGRRFLGVPADIIDDRIDVVGRGLLGLTVGCARCHDHKYDPIPTADYYSLYGVFQNCFDTRVEIPRRPDVPEPKPEFVQGLAERTRKLDEFTVQCRAELETHIRAHVPQYLLAQRELDKYPELTFNLLTNKGDILPGIVHRWAAYLAASGRRADPIFAPWLAFTQLKDDEFASSAIEITQQLQSAAATLHPGVAAAFAQPPASIAEVAESYGALFVEVEVVWQKQCDDARAAGAPLPTALADAELEALRQVLYGDGSPCIVPAEPLVSTEFFWDTATVVQLWNLQGEVDRWLLRDPDAVPQAVVLNDRQQTVEPRIFRRGDPANKGEEVPRQFLAVVAGAERKPFQHGSGRLELAQAIIDPANPLTARVWVNRVWAHHFGTGLVTTPSDFGMRAAPPSHPELLDWLASEFVDGGFGSKALHKLIVTSATYRQDSRASAELAAHTRAAAVDPENRLLWRMNPRRLGFEQFRDALLAGSGEFDLTTGGKGTDLFSQRRSVYTLVDRQFLPSVLSIFDFANPDLHAPQRAETTIPQQALFALNHPFVAARAKAAAAAASSAVSDANDTAPTDQTSLNAKRISWLYQAIYQREPSPDELQAAVQYLSDATADIQPRDAAPSAWTYGYGHCDPAAGRVVSFTPLPHFSGSAWQGGPNWPDAALGWVRLTAEGGHPGNDLQHAAVRRWTAPVACRIAIKSEVNHTTPEGDGIQCYVVSSRRGLLKSSAVHNRRERLDLDALDVVAGDTLDFVVDIGAGLNNDQYLWAPAIAMTPRAGTGTGVAAAPLSQWNAEHDFSGPPLVALTPLEQLAQLLLISNETLFVD